MAEFDVSTGFDTWVSQAAPAGTNSTGRYPALKGGSSDQFQTFLSMPLALSRITGKTILSAILSVPAQGNWVTQTVTVQAVAASWNAGTLKWSNRPGVVGATATSGATGVKTAGQRLTIDVTALIQAIADGQANYGWKITTSQSTDRSTVRGFDSGLASWTLHVEVSDLLVKPTHLAPTGVISVAKPTLIVDDLESLSAIQVQIDSAAAPATVDFDTGWVASTTPQLNLSTGIARTVAVGTTNASPTITFAANLIETADIGATITGTGIPGGTTIIARPTTTTATLSANATATGSITATVTRNYAGLSDGATTYWRARLKTVNGSISAWSDWVDITRAIKPAMVMDNPSGTALWDPTPTISAHLSPAGDTNTRWQVIVQAVGDPTDVRYNSGDHLSGATLEHEVPLRWKGRKVFPVDGNYVLVVKAWDRNDRVPSPGDPTFVRTTTTVTFDADGTVTAPGAVTLSQATSGYPDVIVHWTRASDPDRFTVWRDGEIIQRLDPDDVRVSPGAFEWIDDTAPPNATHVYKVRAVTDVGGGVLKQSVFSPSASILATVTGVWIRTATEDLLLYDDDGPPEVARVDKRQTFVMPYRGEDVDIITAVGYYAGTYAGVVDRRHNIPSTLSLIDELIGFPTATVRLVWSTFNMRATLGAMSYQPHKDSLTTAPKYLVTFGIKQVDEPDE